MPVTSSLDKKPLRFSGCSIFNFFKYLSGFYVEVLMGTAGRYNSSKLSLGKGLVVVLAVKKVLTAPNFF